MRVGHPTDEHFNVLKNSEKEDDSATIDEEDHWQGNNLKRADSIDDCIVPEDTANESNCVVISPRS